MTGASGRAGVRGRAGLVLAAVLFVGVNGLVLAFQGQLLAIAAHDPGFHVPGLAPLHRGPRYDLLFVGSSRAATAFDPRLTERLIREATGETVRALNVGMAAGVIDGQYLLLKNLIDEARQPRVLVYGVSEYELSAVPIQWRSPYLEGLFRLDDFPGYAEGSWRERARFLARRLLPLYRDQVLIRRAAAVVLDPADPAHRAWRERRPPWPDGHLAIRREARVASPLAEAVWRALLSDFRISAARVRRFDAFLALARRRSIDVVMVALPVSARHRSLWTGSAAAREALGGIARRAGVALLDLYDNPGGLVPETAFLDTHHVDRDGAAILTRLVTERLLVERLHGRELVKEAAPPRERGSARPGGRGAGTRPAGAQRRPQPG